MQLDARFAGSGVEAGLVMTGTDQFVTVPLALAVYGDDPNAACAPASSACSVLAKAGDAFPLQVKAACWQSDGDTNLADNPATPNFRMAGIPMTSTLIAPAGGTAAALGVSSFDFVAADAGIHAVSQTVSEVGVFQFSVTPAAGAYHGATVAGRTSADIGRFTPHHLAVSAPGIVNRSDIGGGAGCTPAAGFSYLGEPLQLSFTVTAQNAANGTTRNYSDPAGFSKLNPATASWLAIGANPTIGLGAINDPGNAVAVQRTPLSPRLAIDSSVAAPSGTWSQGTSTFAAHVRIDRNASPDGPFTLVNFGVAPRDADGVTLAAPTFNLDADQNGSSERSNLGVISALRFGRARLDNAFGSELLDLPLHLRLQHWDRFGFVDSADDACTSFAAGDLALNFTANARNNLAACETTVSLAGGAPARLKLTKPGAGNNGWVDARLNLGGASGHTCVGATASPASTANKAYLRGRWSGSSYDEDPTARATFGVYKAPGRVIYLRENY
ncbi:MAG: hypothetical protein MZV65_40220 [Chromatiales bacterium]|nr:hypothetical protein [Chromatiales bacterium]